MENTVAAATGSEAEEAGDVAARIAARTLAKRGPDYTAEVRRLLDAALEVIAEQGTTARARVAPRGGRANEPLASLLHEPLAEIGSADPALHASLVAHAVLGKISDHLWARSRPTRAEREEIVRFCLAGAAPAR
jgi:hypothetical protein